MTSPINFGGGVGTQPVIQNPGIGEQLAPLLEALQRQQLLQQNAEKVALETQLTESRLAEAEAQADARERNEAYREELGVFLARMAAPPEIQDVDVGAAAGGPATASVPVQSPSLGEEVQGLSPAIVEDALKLGAPIQEARDARVAAAAAAQTLKETRRKAMASLAGAPELQEATQIGFNLMDSGAPPSFVNTVVGAFMKADDGAAAKALRADPRVRVYGADALDDDGLLIFWRNYLTESMNAGMVKRPNQDGSIPSATEEFDAWSKAFITKFTTPNEFGQIFKGTRTEILAKLRVAWKDAMMVRTEMSRNLAIEGANLPLTTPPEALLAGDMEDEEVAQVIVEMLPGLLPQGFVEERQDPFGSFTLIDPAEVARSSLEQFLAVSNVDFPEFRVEAILQRAAWSLMNPGK